MAVFTKKEHKQTKIIRDDEVKIPLKFDITVLNMIIGSLFKKSVQVTRKSLLNIQRLFDKIDTSIYVGNDKLEARINFINLALDAKLNQGFESDEAIINYCRSDVFDKENEEIINSIPVYTKLNYEEIKYLNKMIEDRLQYYYLFTYKDKLYSSIERLDSGDYKSFGDINTELVDICNTVINNVRKSKSIENTDSFSFESESVSEDIIDIVTQLKNPSRMLQTGIQKLNHILAPAFMAGRLYTFMGLAGGWKSGMLLKVTRDIKKYNAGIVPSKPGKKPCVLYITMENGIAESVERLFNMCVSQTDIRGYTPKQVVKMMKDSGEFKVTPDDNINVMMRYYANRTIDTADLYTIIDDLDDEGYEVIALVLDYLKRIKPAEKGKDEKEELKNITNELKSLAIDYNIPVITAHQMVA